MKYRPEIDGLRSLAVLPVIFFHAGFSLFSGGYVGVDVFFVISGYLITTILLSEMEQGKFSLVTFYERRARRILPALFFVMFVSSLAALFILSPSHMKDFSQSLVAISLFSSNILFWQETGYWGVENELKPLLHTWSLAVEEQYYVLFPLFLMLMWKFRKRWIFSSFLIIALTSFFLSQYLSSENTTANFFLLPTRGWELAIGSLIAFYFLYRPNTIASLISNKTIDNTMAIVGMGLILFSIFEFDGNTPFPSAYALVPTVGTALIILFASKDTLVGKLLGSKPLVGIGLISYSAYLWHQPLFAYAKHIALIHPSKSTFFILSVLSLLLAAFSWKFIEAPFRNKAKISRGKIFALSLIGTMSFLAFGLFVIFNNGLANRFNSEFKTYYDAHSRNQSQKWKEPITQKQYETDYGSLKYFVVGNQDLKESSFVVWGDSHAKSMLPAIHKSALRNQVQGIFIQRGGCLPLLGAAQVLPQFYENCLKQNKMAFEYLSQNKNIDKVIMISRWSIYAEGERFLREYGHTVLIKDELSKDFSLAENKAVFARSVRRTFSKLNEIGLDITVVRQVPEVEYNVPDAYFKLLMFNYSVDMRPSLVDYKKRNLYVNQLFNNVGAEFSVNFVNPQLEICDENFCSVLDWNGSPIYRDTNHIMPHYAISISHIFDGELKLISKKR